MLPFLVLRPLISLKRLATILLEMLKIYRDAMMSIQVDSVNRMTFSSVRLMYCFD